MRSRLVAEFLGTIWCRILILQLKSCSADYLVPHSHFVTRNLLGGQSRGRSRGRSRWLRSGGPGHNGAAGQVRDGGYGPVPPPWLSTLSVSRSKSFSYGAFVWASRSFSSQNGGFRPGQSAGMVILSFAGVGGVDFFSACPGPPGVSKRLSVP